MIYEKITGICLCSHFQFCIYVESKFGKCALQEFSGAELVKTYPKEDCLHIYLFINETGKFDKFFSVPLYATVFRTSLKTVKESSLFIFIKLATFQIMGNLPNIYYFSCCKI